MLRAMMFIDFENYNIAFNNYYNGLWEKELANKKAEGIDINTLTKPSNPKIDFNLLPLEITKLLTPTHVLLKTYLFAPKPDDFLMKIPYRLSTYNWITGLKNQNFFDVIEGSHIARPAKGFTKSTMDPTNNESFYIDEKGTDVNLAVHAISKGLHNAYDTAIIVSGDTDYIPVMDTLNSVGRTVIVVGVKGQSLQKFKQHSDMQLTLDDELFQRCIRTV